MVSYKEAIKKANFKKKIKKFKSEEKKEKVPAKEEYKGEKPLYGTYYLSKEIDDKTECRMEITRVGGAEGEE